MDLKNEKDNLEYRPSFERKEKLRGSFSTEEEEEYDVGANDSLLITEENINNEIGNGLLTNNILEILNIEKTLMNIKENLYKELLLIKTPVPNEYLSELKDIKKELGLIGNSLTIDDYIYGLNNLKNPSAALLVELWENYHEDVNGNLKAELFGDVEELLNDMSHTKDFISNFLLKKMNSNISFETEDFNEQLLKIEVELKKEQDLKNHNFQMSKQSEIQAMISNPSLIANAKENKYNSELAYQKGMFMFYGFEESNDIIENKIVQMQSVVNSIEKNIEHKSYENPFEITKLLYQRNNEPEKSIPYLHKMNLLVKLDVDNNNEEKHKVKNTIRNIYSIDNKEKIMNELLVESEVFEKVSLDVSHFLKFYDERSSKEGDLFLNRITKSLTKLLQDKKDKTKDFYNIEKSELDLREVKINNILEKEDSRQTYSYINTILNKS